MNASRLIEHFDRISEAPDAIPKLRRLILDLAVRGRLVDQDPRDEPAHELLKKVRYQQQRTSGQSRTRALRAEGHVEVGETPFDVRPGWEMASVGEVLLELQTGPFGSSLHQSDYELIPVPT